MSSIKRFVERKKSVFVYSIVAVLVFANVSPVLTAHAEDIENPDENTDRIAICRATGSPYIPYVKILISPEGADRHFEETDILISEDDECPNQPPQGDDDASGLVRILAHKIVCDNESYLPNWGAEGAPDITENTATEFVENSEGHCQFANDWTFQYGFAEKENQSGVHKLSGEHIGEADGTDTSGQCGATWCGPNTQTGTGYANWKTFGPTEGGMAQVEIADLEGAPGVWVRENLKEGYIPFTYPPQSETENAITAEIYCHTDTYNFDNYDFIQSPVKNHNYYCVAFNAPKPLTIVAHKIVCDNESYLPNWGAEGAPDITENTATEFVENSEGHCRLEPNWSYQWGFSDKDGAEGVDKLHGSHIGEADGTSSAGLCDEPWCGPNTQTGTGYANWKTFGPTDSNGRTSVQITNLEGASAIWVRENLKEGYIPFTYPPYSQIENDQTAEIYCSNDTFNYDNYDLILNPMHDETRYCVAFNAPIEQEIGICGDGILNQTSEQCDVDAGVGENQQCSNECTLINNDGNNTAGGGTTTSSANSGGGGGGGIMSLIIFNEETESVTPPTAVVSWFTNIPATTRVVWGTTPQDGTEPAPNYGYDFSTELDPTKITFHTVTLPNIEPGVTYYWRAVSSASPEKIGIEINFTAPLPGQSGLSDNTTVLGITNDANPDESVKVLGFEFIPETGGSLKNYYITVIFAFSMVTSFLYSLYRNREDLV